MTIYSSKKLKKFLGWANSPVYWELEICSPCRPPHVAASGRSTRSRHVKPWIRLCCNKSVSQRITTWHVVATSHQQVSILTICCFWPTVCKRVRPMLSDRCLSVCNVGVLWPNGWMDQDETRHAGRPRPWPHCVRWRPSSPLPQKGGGAPQFSAHAYCDQTAGWTKMPLGMEVGLGPGDFVLDGDPVPPQKKRA